MTHSQALYGTIHVRHGSGPGRAWVAKGTRPRHTWDTLGWEAWVRAHASALLEHNGVAKEFP